MDAAFKLKIVIVVEPGYVAGLWVFQEASR